MAKEFKTIEELVLLLESRGVETDGDTPGILKRESYYAIVNGYKDPFLDRRAMQSSSSDVYKAGTTFRQLYDLYCFDRDMRGALLPYLMEAESCLKNAVVYAFCERNREPDAYLNRSNYTSAKDMLLPRGFAGNKREEHSKRLNGLMAKLNGKLALSNSTRPYVRHYLETYGNVPLWVLQNDLTFGNIHHFYQLQKRGIQNATCRIVEEQGGRRIAARELLNVFNVLVGFRNICAHGDRLYCADIKGWKADEMLTDLGLVLPKDRRENAIEMLMSIADKYAGRVEPSCLNSMYTDPSQIPTEFRRGA